MKRLTPTDLHNLASKKTDVVGLDVGAFGPYLGAIGGALGGALQGSGLMGGGKSDDGSKGMMQMMMLQNQQQAARDAKAKREADEKAAKRNSLILYSVLGVVGLTVVGGGLYFAFRHK